MKIVLFRAFATHMVEKAFDVFLGLLILGLLFLCYRTGRQWSAYEHDLDTMAIAPKAFAVSTAQLPPVPALASYRSIASMPVFHENRRAYASKPVIDSAAIALRNLQHYTLIGIIFSPSGKKQAFFKSQQSGGYVTLTKDKKIEGCSVVDFSKIEVTLDCGHVEKKFAVREVTVGVGISVDKVVPEKEKSGGPRILSGPHDSRINRTLRLPRK